MHIGVIFAACRSRLLLSGSKDSLKIQTNNSKLSNSHQF